MMNHRFSAGDAELTSALRALYAAPADEHYWDGLEARILAHVARAGSGSVWWAELAAALVFAAGLALVHSRQLEVSRAYAAVISPAPASIGASSRASSVGDGDVAIRFLISR